MRHPFPTSNGERALLLTNFSLLLKAKYGFSCVHVGSIRDGVQRKINAFATSFLKILLYSKRESRFFLIIIALFFFQPGYRKMPRDPERLGVSF